MAQEGKKRKRFFTATALVTAAAVVLTGTYAWQSISQTALNEVAQLMNPGGRLHDDFNGKTKSVYVENFTDSQNGGVPIFARIRLDEYMEIGSEAGKNKDAVHRDAKPLISTASIHDYSTWKTYVPDDGTDTGDVFQSYWQWKMGGRTVYMPTFNKNKDSLLADVNGTYAGIDGNPDTDDDRYLDYVAYTAGATKTGNEIYDADANNVDEGTGAIVPDNITIVENQTHRAKETEDAAVISMAKWKEMGSPLGNYWVYDCDGWAYFANPILPGTATGPLLKEIEMVKEPTENWYYAIHVTAQFASRGDWGEPDGTGFYNTLEGLPPSADALTLLNKAAAFSSDNGVPDSGTSGENATDKTLPQALQQVKAIPPGSMEKVEIDGIQWYVVAKEGEEAMLWSAEMIPSAKEGFSNFDGTWRNSSVRQWMNTAYLPQLPTLAKYGTQKQIASRENYNTEIWVDTADTMFLLTEADLCGTYDGVPTNDARDYSYGNTQLITNTELMKCSSEMTNGSWLRSQKGGEDRVAVLDAGGNVADRGYKDTGVGLRPAIWIDLRK